MLKSARINHTIRVARVGVYESTIEIIDDQTGEQVAHIVREHPRRQRCGVARSSLDEAYEIAREHGYDHISKLNSTEGIFDIIEDY